MPEKKRCQMERKENKVRFCARSEVLADWKWLLTYSRRCKKMIALYIALGVLGTTVGLFGSVAGKYLIDIVTGYDTARLPAFGFRGYWQHGGLHRVRLRGEPRAEKAGD